MTKPTIEERFWSKVAITGSDDCWLWTASTMKPDHKRIWLQPWAGDCGETTWCQDRIHDDDIEYVRTDIHEQALLSAYNRGLEDAAKVADRYGSPAVTQPLAAAIRAKAKHGGK